MAGRDFALLWTGGAVSELGTAMSAFVYPLLAFRLTGSVAQAGFAGSGFAVGFVVAGLPAGVLVDRWDRRWTLVGANGAAALVTTALVAASMTGRLALAELVVAAFVVGVASSFVPPAETAALRQVVPADQLGAAFSRNQARRHIGTLGGPPAAGALFSAVRWLPLLGDAVSFLLAAAAASLIRTPLPAPARAASDPSGMRRELTEGLRYLLSRSVLRAFTVFAAGANLVGDAVLLVLTLKLLRAGAAPTAIGVVTAVGGLAGIAGAFSAPVLMRRLPAGLLICGSGLVSTLALVPIAFSDSVVVCAGCLAVRMCSIPASNASLSAYLVAVTPDRLQGRVWSGLEFASGIVWPAGPVLGGVALAGLGGRGAMLACAAGGGLSVLALVLTPALRALPRPDRWGPEHGLLVILDP